MTWQPKVSIGVPLYNAEGHVATALGSLAAQTHPNLEIVVSDNHSTDGTYAACLAFAQRNPLVRVFQQPRNIGAIGNFNYVLAQATGKFFLWAAHDDLRDPTYVAECVAALDRQPSANVAQSQVRLMDQRGRMLETVYRKELSDDADPIARFDAVLNTHWWTHVIYGLFRRDFLVRANGYPRLVGGDKVLVANAVLVHGVAYVDRPLFTYKVDVDDHGQQLEKKSWYVSPRATTSFVARHFPYTDVLLGYLRVMANSSLGALAKGQALAHLARWYGVEIAMMKNLEKLSMAFPRLRAGTALPRRLLRNLRHRKMV
ncbi:MAG: glycosyltransferase family A protein [Gaiellales bacterium]